MKNSILIGLLLLLMSARAVEEPYSPVEVSDHALLFFVRPESRAGNGHAQSGPGGIPVLYVFDPSSHVEPQEVWRGEHPWPRPITRLSRDVLVLEWVGKHLLLDMKRAKVRSLVGHGVGTEFIDLVGESVYFLNRTLHQDSSSLRLGKSTTGPEKTVVKHYERPKDYLYQYEPNADGDARAELVADLAIEKLLHHDDECAVVVSAGDAERKGRKLCRITYAGEVEEIAAIDDHWVASWTNARLSPMGRFLAVTALHDEHDFHKERELVVVDLVENKVAYLEESITDLMPVPGIGASLFVHWHDESLLSYGFAGLIDLSGPEASKRPFSDDIWDQAEDFSRRQTTGMFDHEHGLLFFRGEEEPTADVRGDHPGSKVSNLEIDSRGEWAAFVSKGPESNLYLVNGFQKEKSLLLDGWCYGVRWLPEIPLADAMPQVEPLSLPANLPLASELDLANDFTFRMCVRMSSAPQDLPTLAANKAWESGEIVDYTTNNSFGLGRASGALAGFAISVLPDGAWTWNAGDGKRRIDHRPEAADQGIADGLWHEVGFSIDRESGIAQLFHDGRRVALHDLQGVGSLNSGEHELQIGNAIAGLEIGEVRVESGVLSAATLTAEFVERFGEERAPPAAAIWDGEPLKVLAWNIWHGGRRKGRDEGVARVVGVIEESGADIVLMQETYGSGPRISARLGFDYFLRSSNLSIMSRYPIEDVHRLYQGFRFGGATIRLRPDLAVQAYSLWINYLPDVGKQLEEGATGEELAAADAKTRGSEMNAILEELLPHLEKTPGMPVIVAGDFNSGSHLDWTSEAAELPNHMGRSVPWPVSLAMERAGFVDTFRTAHPSPVAFPGNTWSPEFTESHPDRIDYVYVRGEPWQVLDSKVLDQHERGWPSDHAAVLSTLDLKPAKPRINVMSYNIKHGYGNDGVIDLERVAKVIESASPDIVTLQEVDDRCGRSGNVDQAAWLGERLGMQSRFGSFMDYDGGRYGMAILSRLPIVSSENLQLPPGAEPRSALATRVRLADGSEVVVVGIHLYATEAERLAQARAVLASYAEETAPVILAGDFNSQPGSLVMRLFEEQFENPSKGEDRLTFPSDKPDREIDFFLVRSTNVLSVDVLDEPLVSDHRPLVIELEF